MDNRIWIDIENTPHVPFFLPIIKRLQDKKYKLLITARNYGGIYELLEKNSIEYYGVGGDYGKSKFKKVLGVLRRILNLFFLVRKININVSISHGSRTHLGAAWLARIPAITSYDYEYSSKLFVHELSDLVIIPKLIPKEILEVSEKYQQRIKCYDGFKEQLYLDSYKPSEDIINNLNLDSNKVIVFIRPPAFNAHYFTEKSNELFLGLINLLAENQNVCVIISPRDPSQEKIIQSQVSNHSNFIILKKQFNGLDLIWYSDLVISGGGTMNREAALLGVPVYSIYGGKVGCLDKELVRLNRLSFINSTDDLKNIKLIKNNIESRKTINSNIIDTFIENIENISRKK